MPNKPRARFFLAVDGEGLSRDDGQHDYVLLAASDNTMVERWEVDGLSTNQCFEYLLDLHNRNKRATLVAFSFGYDVNMMLRDVSRAELERINEGEYTVIERPECSYIVRFIPGKTFYVGRGKYTRNGKWITEIGVTVWDVWGFFQSSFVNALAEWKIAQPETIDIIARMKGKRGEFGDDMRALITSYCFRECQLLVDLMNEFKAVVDASNVKLNRWDGAGALAGTVMRQYKMKQHIEPSQRTPDEVERAALYAYFGGRIETYGAGVIPEACYEYDINSAYPAEIETLPSMHGDWTHVGAEHIGCDWGLWRVRWNVQDHHLIGPFPWRDKDGAVLYPLQGEGWYHTPEVEAARTIYGSTRVEVIEGWVFHPDRSWPVSPFNWVADLYAKRRIFKQSGDARHIVIKLALNAGYGKLAQSVGFNKTKPPAYQSFYLAGRVTSGTRAKMLRALHAAGRDNVISTMTDALFVRERIAGLHLSNLLGDWSETELKPGLLVVQPGVVLSPESECEGCDGKGCYRCNEGRSMSFGRSRGFYRSSLNYDNAYKAWRERGLFGSFSVIERRFIGMGRALAAVRLAEWHLEREPERDMLGNLISEMWRRWVEIEKSVSFRANLERKRTGDNPRAPEWITWYPPEGEITLGAIYEPKTVYRDLRVIKEQDAVEQVDVNESAGLL